MSLFTSIIDELFGFDKRQTTENAEDEDYQPTGLYIYRSQGIAYESIPFDEAYKLYHDQKSFSDICTNIFEPFGYNISASLKEYLRDGSPSFAQGIEPNIENRDQSDNDYAIDCDVYYRRVINKIDEGDSDLLSV